MIKAILKFISDNFSYFIAHFPGKFESIVTTMVNNFGGKMAEKKQKRTKLKS